MRGIEREVKRDRLRGKKEKERLTEREIGRSRNRERWLQTKIHKWKGRCIYTVKVYVCLGSFRRSFLPDYATIHKLFVH